VKRVIARHPGVGNGKVDGINVWEAGWAYPRFIGLLAQKGHKKGTKTVQKDKKRLFSEVLRAPPLAA